ncbi:nucleotidyl transferase AbiEii/AbiGii toxin family protein [Chryseobacterium sp. R2ACT005]|uniref:nucleotidyl transferase AbiEii/AbiGii toxin family protein n=1 Tax=Chryseobacterium sp. R2ACT005 TaxID=3416668 RepID=UPI003CFBC167
MLYKETVSNEMWGLLQKLMKDEKLKDYILVGGTALSLKIGHRKSVDIDLFTTKDFDSKEMFDYLNLQYDAVIKESKLYNNTVLTFINDIKVDIVAHKYPLLNPVEINEGIRMISNEDIGAMKLHAIFQSGKRLKDFVDMYFLLEEKPLKDYLQAYEKKYCGHDFLAAYALSFFGNIDFDKAFDVSMMKGKENNWPRMSERLKKAAVNPELKFEIKFKQENGNKPPQKGRGFRR